MPADGGHWGILAGQPTDDSEMALMLARALVQRKIYDPAAALVLRSKLSWGSDGKRLYISNPACSANGSPTISLIESFHRTNGSAFRAS
jgi:ADP-ribosylglycohydrolase